MSRLARMRRSLVAPVVVAILVALPAGVALAGGPTFTDVPTSHLFYADVEAVAAAGVTSGCTATTYCPNANVTRGQMAAFMNRLGALGVGKTPVVNAKTSQSVDGWSSGCPANTTYSQGQCFDNALRGDAASIYAASDACAAIGTTFPFFGGHRWHLPSANELLSANRVAGLTLNTTSADAEWASDMWIDTDDGWVGLQVYDTTFGPLSRRAAGNDPSPYRCATEPHSWDGLSLIIVPDGDAPAPVDPGTEASVDAQLRAQGD